ncbi:hypothetical protein [Paraliomyxa miuraensis]|uniref:hypothetical protein n=1 Tax=Paraliomyxa miuraensis TaxID=376150 RepID=UPI002258CD51|nr:hypothetical protein [Paraliomyxa miuraensis]MCX4248105.1 hypothetical protein [Paraliomyxa miuraensis]
MTSILLATMFLFNDPTGGAPICDDAQETIDALEAEIDEHERNVLVLDDVFYGFYFSANPTGGTGATCDTKPTNLEKDICECIRDNNNGHPTLTDCITAKQGGPTGGL